MIGLNNYLNIRVHAYGMMKMFMIQWELGWRSFHRSVLNWAWRITVVTQSICVSVYYLFRPSYFPRFICLQTKLLNSNANSFSIHTATHPLPEGNMTIGIYTDNTCLTLSEEIDYASYIVMYYENYYKESWYYRYYGYNSYCEYSITNENWCVISSFAFFVKLTTLLRFVC